MNFFLASFFCLLGLSLTDGCPSNNLATPNLRDLVIGKCLEYQIKINPNVFCDGRKDCEDIWQKFFAGFAHQPQCNVSSAGFRDFVMATSHSVPNDKLAFWENVYTLVHRYSNLGANLVTLADTLTGYIVDSLKFCGDKSQSNGIADGSVCPGFEFSEDCQMSAERAFWIIASEEFAKKAAGQITVMLNATDEPIYNKDSYFAMHEAPYLRDGTVTNAKIILINERTARKNSGDLCSDPSLKELFSLLENKNIQISCEENPREVMLMYCTDHTTSPLCTIDGVSRAPVLLQDVIVILQVLMLSAFCRGVI